MMVDKRSLYKKMLRTRLVETELQKLCLTGEAGDLHFNKGQEAISTGVIAALDPADYIVTHHRTISHTLSKGTELKPLLAEILGRANGTNKGLAGEMHFRNPRVGHLFSFQIVGTCLPVAVGVAWSVKYFRKEPAIVACFLGDASSSNAQFHEGMNIAAVKKVPLLIVCENNGLAGNIRAPMYLPVSTVSERARGYGIQSRCIDGNDILGVYEAAKEISNIVREKQEPFFLECKTTRLCWHKQGQPDARSKEELCELAKLDPIPRLGKHISEKEKAEIEKEVEAEVKECLEYALSSPWPE